MLAIAWMVFAVLADDRGTDSYGEFWGRLYVRGSEVEDYTSLAEMARASDAVVVGRITSVDPGRVFGELIPELPDPEDGLVRYASMRIAVDEIVAGELPPDDVESLQLEAMVPQFRNMTFLMQRFRRVRQSTSCAVRNLRRSGWVTRLTLSRLRMASIGSWYSMRTCASSTESSIHRRSPKGHSFSRLTVAAWKTSWR
jgi:hypothetical protein